MNIKNTIKITGLTALLSLLASTPLQAGTFDSAVQQASAEIDKAKAMNYEWRDSRKLLKKAIKLHKEGKHDKAMKLVAKAGQQGKLAVAQAQQQAGVNGPHR